MEGRGEGEGEEGQQVHKEGEGEYRVKEEMEEEKGGAMRRGLMKILNSKYPSSCRWKNVQHFNYIHRLGETLIVILDCDKQIKSILLPKQK